MGKTFTVTQLAEALGEPLHIVAYAIKRFGPHETGRVGGLRFWLADALDAVKASVARTRANRRPAPVASK